MITYQTPTIQDVSAHQLSRPLGEARTLNVLFVRNLFRPQDFGGNRYPWEVTRRLAARGHRVRVITPRPGGPLPGRTTADLTHYPVSRRTPFETFITNAICSRFAVEAALHREPVDVVVLSSYDVAYGYYLLPRRRPPSVFIYHSRFRSDAVERLISAQGARRLVGSLIGRFVTWVERMTYLSADFIVAVSPFSLREIEQRLGRRGCRIAVIPTGVDTKFFTPGDRADARRAIGLGVDDIVLLTAGRLAPVKRYDRAIRALKILRSDDPRYRLLLVGVGPEELALRQLTNELGVDDAVRFEGFLDGAALLLRYRSADVQLCTSEFENWSLALLEGLSTGLPVFGVPRGGIPELLRLVDEDLIASGVEPEHLAGIVARYVLNGEWGRRVRQRAREVAVARFDWERVVDELERRLHEAAKK